jgi:hypothetical protein
MARAGPQCHRGKKRRRKKKLGGPSQRRLMSRSSPTITHYLETPGISAWQGIVIGRLHITRHESGEVTGQILYS